jgi:hypothetical protein
MLNKAISSILLIIVLLSFHSKKNVLYNDKSIYIILYDSIGSVINLGHIHILSNDLIINDILFSEWDNEEKKGLHKIPQNGKFEIPYSIIEMNNKINLDSISIVYRCDKSLGTEYKIPVGIDTIHIRNVLKCSKK